VELPGYDGRGVTIALLDTGVDRAHEYLRGRVQEGYDIVSGGDSANPHASPEDPTRIEAHGTEMAGILVGAGGPAGLAGIATGASVLPIRVAGWQPDIAGHYAVYARSDQLLAGLERAVDPNEDGDAHDGARIALIPLAEPFAAFPDSPESRAVAGALALDTIVVAPAGNDGSSGPGYGSIAGPGGAPAALTVAAADARRSQQGLRVVLRRGLDVQYDRIAPLLNAVAVQEPRTLGIASPRVRTDTSILSFFDRRGYSLVAGKAVLAAAGENPHLLAAAAAHAGAAAVVLYGRDLPAGSLGIDEDLRIPVVSVPAESALAVLAAKRLGADVSVSIGRLHREVNSGSGRIAEFSSRGLAFDGRVKPELAAAGVGVATSEPGAADDGSPRFVTVSGSSVSAAVVAGAAALLVHARPGLAAADLRGLLVGAGRRLDAEPTTAQGVGLVDVGAAAAAEVTAAPASLAFGAAKGTTWRSTRYVTIKNVTSRRVHVALTAHPEGGESEVLSFAIEPDRFLLRQGHTRTIRVTARLAARPSTPSAAGTLVIGPEGGQQIRVPWAIDFRPYTGPLLARVRLSDKSFEVSDAAPSVLSLHAGNVVASGRNLEIEPVARLDVHLFGAGGESLGLLARLRDLLPGRYDFGLTGRDPVGNQLAPGNYRLRLDAFPVAPGPPTRSTLRFTIK
jgi:subtilisin family serine protease